MTDVPSEDRRRQRATMRDADLTNGEPDALRDDEEDPDASPGAAILGGVEPPEPNEPA